MRTTKNARELDSVQPSTYQNLCPDFYSDAQWGEIVNCLEHIQPRRRGLFLDRVAVIADSFTSENETHAVFIKTNFAREAAKLEKLSTAIRDALLEVDGLLAINVRQGIWNYIVAPMSKLTKERKRTLHSFRRLLRDRNVVEKMIELLMREAAALRKIKKKASSKDGGFVVTKNSHLVRQAGLLLQEWRRFSHREPGLSRSSPKERSPFPDGPQIRLLKAVFGPLRSKSDRTKSFETVLREARVKLKARGKIY